MSLPFLKFSKNGYDDLLFNSVPAAIRGYDPAVNSILAVSVNDTVYTQLLGNPHSLISVVFNKEHPLRFVDYDGGFNWITKAQAAGTQSLANWFLNVAIGTMNSFTIERGDDTATVNLMNNPLGFKPRQGKDDEYVGELILRIQY